jgi:hypothetical protein
MTAWSIAPWLIALAVAAGLGVFGRFSDVRARRRREAEDAAYDESYPDDF